MFPISSETANPSELKFWGMIPLGMEKVLGLKTFEFVEPLAKKIACIVGMYTSDPSGQFYSLQYEYSTYLGGW